MRIGLVAGNQDIVEVLTEFNGEIAWLVGAQGGGFDGPIYEDLSEAIALQGADLVIDCTGEIVADGVPILDVTSARYLLSIGRKGREPKSAEFWATTDQLNSNINQIGVQMEAMTTSCRQLTEVGHQLDAVSQGILEALDRTKRILDSITRIAKRSKIIGLNSAIEAARVGELGRGFAVVAEEIKTLADDSSRSVREIEKILAGIQRRSNEFAQRIGTVQDVSELQHQTTGQISALLQAIKELGEHLHQLSQETA